MRVRPAFLSVVACLAVGGAACSHQPDTALHPDPPSVTYTAPRHPFRHATLYLETNTAARRWQKAHDASWLDPITTRPQVRWLNGPRDLAGVPELAARARARDELPVFVAYYLPNRGCSDYKQGAPTAAAYGKYV